MSRLFRVTIWPVIVALPLVLASLSPSRFFADARATTFFVFMIFGLGIENAIVDPRSIAESSSKEQKSRDRRSFELSSLTNIGCFYAPVYDYFHLQPIIPRNATTLVIGLLLMVVGEGMRVVALRTLGRFFTMRVAVLEGHRVVREGLYRLVRHPAYTGWFLLSLGVGVFFGSIVGVIGTSLFVVVLGWRVTVEEAALKESLGDEYQRYVDDVPSRFLPGIF